MVFHEEPSPKWAHQSHEKEDSPIAQGKPLISSPKIMRYNPCTHGAQDQACCCRKNFDPHRGLKTEVMAHQATLVDFRRGEWHNMHITNSVMTRTLTTKLNLLTPNEPGFEFPGWVGYRI